MENLSSGPAGIFVQLAGVVISVRAVRECPSLGVVGHWRKGAESTRPLAEKVGIAPSTALERIRRLRDVGFSPWWQLVSLAPVAGIPVLLYLLTFPTQLEQPAEASAG